jgi:AcrR family transcriptional regulator
VPATRPHLDRDAKRSQILDAAEKLLLRDGYDATPMAAIARRAGVANAAVYWYFPSKDDVLAAVLKRRQERALATAPDAATASLDDRVIALLEQLDEVANLTAAVHERASRSAAVAEVHRGFHAAAEGFLRTEFRAAGLRVDDARRAAAAIMAIVEGIHLHEREREPAARNELVLWTLHRLLPAAAPKDSTAPLLTNAFEC